MVQEPLIYENDRNPNSWVERKQEIQSMKWLSWKMEWSNWMKPFKKDMTTGKALMKMMEDHWAEVCQK